MPNTCMQRCGQRGGAGTQARRLQAPASCVLHRCGGARAAARQRGARRPCPRAAPLLPRSLARSLRTSASATLRACALRLWSLEIAQPPQQGAAAKRGFSLGIMRRSPAVSRAARGASKLGASRLTAESRDPQQATRAGAPRTLTTKGVAAPALRLTSQCRLVLSASFGQAFAASCAWRICEMLLPFRRILQRVHAWNGPEPCGSTLQHV